MRILRHLRTAAAAVVVLAFAACGGGTPGQEEASPEIRSAITRSRKEHADAWKRKVIVLGFDSCDGDLVDQMIREGRLPNFARVRREGAYGLLESRPPLLSPIVWTTIATGVPPARHGILDFVTNAGGRMTPVSSKMRTADTVWEIVSRLGDSVGVIGWLVTWPAQDPLNGFLVTDRMGQLAFDYGKEQTLDEPYRTWPETLAAEVEKKDRVTVDDVRWEQVRAFADVTREEFAAAYATRFHPTNRLGNLRLTLATAETFRRAGQRLYTERRPRFFATYFEAMDALSHLFMPFAPPKMPGVDEADFLRYRNAIAANYMWHDAVLGEYLAIAEKDPDTTLFIVSDHGFKNGDFRRNDSSDFHAKTGAMWHRPFGVFYAWGSGIRRGARVDGASTLDVAPTILATMGYPKPKDMPGRVLTAAFDATLPAFDVPTYFGDARKQSVAQLNAESTQTAALTPEEAAALDRLASLGYIGGDRTDPSTSKLNLGHHYMSTGRFQDALDQYTKVWETDPTPQVAAAVASAWLSLGDLDKAEEWTQKALSMDATDIAAQVAMIRIHLRRGEPTKALAILDVSLAAHADLPAVHVVGGQVWEALEDAAKKANDPGRCEEARNRALELYRVALRLEPNDPQAATLRANLLLTARPWNPEQRVDAQSTEEALRLFDHALRIRPGYPLWQNNRSIALLRLGMLAREAGRADECEKHLLAAITSADEGIRSWRDRTGKEYAKAWANRAYALWQLDRLDEAAESAKKALAAEPGYTLSPRFLAKLQETGRDLTR